MKLLNNFVLFIFTGFLSSCTHMSSIDDPGVVGPNGGQLKYGDNFNVEVLREENELKFHVYDKNNNPVMRKMKLRAKIGPIGSKSEYTVMFFDKKASLTGRFDPEIEIGKGFRVKTQVLVKNKKEEIWFLMKENKENL